MVNKSMKLVFGRAFEFVYLNWIVLIIITPHSLDRSNLRILEITEIRN